jgi:hypothetical protein
MRPSAAPPSMFGGGILVRSVFDCREFPRRARTAAGHVVRHQLGQPLRPAPPRSAELAPGRGGPVAAGRHSYSLARLAAIEASRGPFSAAHAAVARRCEPVVGKPLARSVSPRISPPSTPPEPCTPEALLILSADSKG